MVKEAVSDDDEVCYEEEEEVVVESDDDAGVAWTPYTSDDARLGYVFVPPAPG